jgi:hypothetical protein
VTNLAIVLYIELRIYTCDCDNKLELPEDTSSTTSNISRGCWLLWGQVRVISSRISLGFCAGDGPSKFYSSVQAQGLLLFVRVFVL